MSAVPTKFISKLIHGRYPYSIQIEHPALMYKGIRWQNRGNTLYKVEPFFYKLTHAELTFNRAARLPALGADLSKVHAEFSHWDGFVDWVQAYLKNKPDAIGRMRHEGSRISFYCTTDTFCLDLMKAYPKICVAYRKIQDLSLLPVMEKAAKERTWLLQKEYVEHYPYKHYRYRIYLKYEAKDACSGLTELFKGYEEAGLIKPSTGMKPLLAGAGRLRYPSHILIKTADVMELIKLALGPSLIQSITEYVLLSEAHSSP